VVQGLNDRNILKTKKLDEIKVSNIEENNKYTKHQIGDELPCCQERVGESTFEMKKKVRFDGCVNSAEKMKYEKWKKIFTYADMVVYT